jgi:hypothetical protein
MGSSKPATTYSPGEAAQAATGAAGAGEIMSIADQPIEQYSQLATTEALGPAQMQAQQSLANQAARSGAQAQMDIQSSVDPQAYAQRQLRMNAANKRLGQLYGVDPTSPSYSAPEAYSMPTTASTPTLQQLGANAQAIASNISTAGVNKAGADPQIHTPTNAKLTLPYTYF